MVHIIIWTFWMQVEVTQMIIKHREKKAMIIAQLAARTNLKTVRAKR